MKRVFVSYSHAASDAKTAERIQEFLRNEGFEVWRVDRLVAGSDWRSEILSAVRRCSAFVALVDESNPNVMLEIGYALGASKPVFLVSNRGSHVPFDVASLPVFQLDSQLSLSQLSEALHAVKSEAAPGDVAGGRDVLRRMLEDADFLESVGFREFETSVALLFRELGFETEELPSSHDGGYDIRAVIPQDRFVAIVQAKKYSRGTRIGVENVRALLGALTMSKASCAILAATSEFSASARSLANSSPGIILLTLEELLSATVDSLKTAALHSPR